LRTSLAIAPRTRQDRALGVVLRSSALLAASLIFLVLLFVVFEARGALATPGFGAFFTDPSWHPVDDGTGSEYGVLPMLAATLATTFGALLIATPLGIGAGVFNALVAPAPFALLHRSLVEILAGIPSVVYGLWGLVVLVPWIGGVSHSGQGLLAASIVLSLMLLPTITLSTEAALLAVPKEQLQAAAALGLGPIARARLVAVPAARRGIVAGLVLATGRAVGETMAVLMVAGNVVAWPRGLRDPLRTLTGNIALEMGYATESHRSALFVVGLVLMLCVALLVILAGLFGSGKNHSVSASGSAGR
jgi:phosphate transport system permease protein